MDQYTDDERVEDLKKWWSDNGLSIIAGIALGIAAIFGWRYWNTYRDTQAEQASLAYDVFIQAVEKPDAEQARQRGRGVLADFPNSPYAALTALRLAKLAVESGDNATAIQQLQWVIDHSKLAELRDIARLRLARVWLAADQLSDAEKLLDNVSTSSLTAELEELRGDLYLAGNDTAKARAAYAAALAAGSTNHILQIKLDNLAVPTADTVIAAPAPPPPPPPIADAPSASVSKPEAVPAAEEPASESASETTVPVESTPEAAVTEPAPAAAAPAATEPAPESAPAAVTSTPAPEAVPAAEEPAPESASEATVPVESTPEAAVTEPAPAAAPAAPAEPTPAMEQPDPVPPASTSGPSS